MNYLPAKSAIRDILAKNAERARQLMACARWNRAHANLNWENGNDEAARRQEEQAASLSAAAQRLFDGDILPAA
jgi:hypothetical protein